MKISGFLKWCFVPIFVSGTLFIVSGAFENVVDAIVHLRKNPTPEIQFNPCEFSCDNRDSDDRRCEGSNECQKEYTDKHHTTTGMSGIIIACVGAATGAILGCGFTLIQRTFEQWRIFQGKIYMIRYRLTRIEIGEHFPLRMMASHHDDSLEEVTAAVCEVKPYLFFSWQRDSLDALLNKYYEAQKSPEFTGVMNPANLGADSFGDSGNFRKLLVGILDEMLRPWV